MEEIDFFIKVVRCTIIVIDVLSLIGNSINIFAFFRYKRLQSYYFKIIICISLLDIVCILANDISVINKSHVEILYKISFALIDTCYSSNFIYLSIFSY